MKFKKMLKKTLVLLIMVFMIGLYVAPMARVQAISGFNLVIEFASDYTDEQGHVEYQLDGGSWTSVSENLNIEITDEAASIKFKVVPETSYEVNFESGPELDGREHVSFNAGDAEDARAALTGDGYETELTDGITEVSLTGVAFRETATESTANLSISIQGSGLEYWEDAIPSRITFRLPGTGDIAFGSDNLTWTGDVRPPNATGVRTTNPVSVDYDYDNSGNVTFTYTISNANTKITSLRINGTDYTANCPQSDEEILDNIESGGRSTKPVNITVPHSADYEIEVEAEVHDLMGGFGWNYLPEESLDGDSREDCIAHGTLSFVRGEYNGNTYSSVSEWNSAGAVFRWRDGNKNYTDEAEAWGEAAFPKGAKITMKLIPDEGYQLISLYGDNNIEPQEEAGVYTITMAGGMNSHLMATFRETADVVNVTSSAVSAGSVSNVENTYGEGTMKLGVDDADVSGESQAGFDSKAEEEDAEIQEIVDINLANTIYKASDDPNNAWDRPIEVLDNPAEITLELTEDYSGKDIIIIHEHDGEYEVIDAAYDSANNSVTFETSSFSNYAIATVEPQDNQYKITVTTDGNGTADGPKLVDAGEKAVVITLEPKEGYIFDSVTADGISEGDDGTTYSLMYSGWPTVGIYINEMPANEITFDVKFKPDKEDEKYTAATEDENFIVEFTDEKDKPPFSLVVVDYLGLTPEELAAMDISQEMFDDMMGMIKDITKPSGELLGVYEIMLIGEEGEEVEGRPPYTLKIKITDDLKNYTDFKLTDINGLGDDGFTPGTPIELKVVDGYLVATVDRLGTYALNGTPLKESDGKSDSSSGNKNPRTGDEESLIFWILLAVISASGILLAKRS